LRKSFSFVSVFALVAMLSSTSAVRAAAPPAALQPGSNEGIADSFVGNQDWTFAADPGPFELVVTLGRVPTNALPGAPFAVVLHITPLSNSKITFAKTPGGYVFRGRILKPVHLRLTVIPPTSTLVREASEYTIAASGSIVYKAGADPVIGTYTGPNGLGAVRFLPGGVVRASSGDTGTWVAFDPQLHIYTVVVGQTRWSLKLVPGQGLNDASNGNITFQTVH
jgi:hypothetical protein